MNNINTNYLSGLNEQQIDAVLCHSDIVYVNAGPGTGKTTLLTSKLIDYIESSDTVQQIVALSFTNAAARQIGERFHNMMEKQRITREHQFFNGTIHSFCYRMMKAYCLSSADVWEYIILDDEELQELANDIREHIGASIPVTRILECLRAESPDLPDDISDRIEQIKRSFKVMSVQDILAFFIRLLDTDPSFREWISRQITVIAVDEAQDLTALHYAILDRLINIIPGLKVFLVGDPRQNIFEFNGGSYRYLDEFLGRHSLCEHKSLTITYRCGQAIADYVNGFHFTDCCNEKLVSMCESAGRLSIKQAPNEREEAEMVLQYIRDTGNTSSCAVLSNNLKYLKPFISLLKAEEIPFKVFGGRKTIKRKIRFMNHILRIIDTDNAYSVSKVAQYAGINLLENGKRRKAKFFESELGQIVLSIRQETEGLPFCSLMESVLERIMRDDGDDEETIDDYSVMLAIASQYQSISEYLMAFATDNERFARFYDKDSEDCPIPTDNGFLTISTIHSAKGLEWDNVFIMGLCEGNFPNPYFCKSLPPKEQEAFYNGELKKMYVASTRARESLCLSYARTITRKGFVFSKEPSRFLDFNHAIYK